MHQPVHVGDSGDRGGNDLQLRFFDVGTNLHRLLDTQILERYGKDEALLAQELHAVATSEKAIQWTTGTVEDWATESLDAAKLAYRQPSSQDLLKPGTKLGEEYFQAALPILRLQLARASSRVAFVLNRIFR